jgi:hypothetical protein
MAPVSTHPTAERAKSDARDLVMRTVLAAEKLDGATAGEERGGDEPGEDAPPL